MEKIKESDLFIGPFPLNSIVFADYLESMSMIPDKSFDIAIVDPPYNLSKGNTWKWDRSIKLPGFGGEWSKVMEGWDNMSLNEYFQFIYHWVKDLKRVIKPSGSIWIHGTYHNIGIINFILQLLKIEIINEVIWYKRNSFPNLSGRRLTASHETIIWAHSGKKREYLFNYGKVKNVNFPEDNLHKTGTQMRTVWDIPNNKEKRELKFGRHPTQKPLRLLNRMLMISAKENQKCLIPFAGSGSECVACIESGLNFLAFEIDSKYISIAKKRMDEATNNLFRQGHYDIKIINREGKLLALSELNDSENKKKKKVNIPPLIKWTGSKRLHANEIYSYFPEYNRYFEPFLGSGALLFLNCNKEAYAYDIYEPLIKYWILVRDGAETVINDYKKKWNRLQNNLPSYFYKIRQRFNLYHDPLDLLFLTRTCVNGIVRFNRKGEFNNSFHLSRKGMNPETFAKIARKWSSVIKNVHFDCKDYREILNEVARDDFVYLDPPYAGNKDRFIIEKIELNEFFSFLKKLNSKKVKFALSFDGFRDKIDLSFPIPTELYKRKVLIRGVNSAVKKVLNRKTQKVEEYLYLSY